MIDNLKVCRYSAVDREAWDAFVAASKNGTFLFHRAFMEYHADRFQDHSLMVWNADQLVAVLPANLDGSRCVTHGGLTYGGLITGARMSAELALKIFDMIVEYGRGQGWSEIYYKPVPHIYHRQPAEEDLYALFRHDARLVRSDVSATISLQDRLSFSKGKKDGLRKARKAGLVCRESQDWAACWTLLTQVLSDRHAVKPVHALEEITQLAADFPNQIRLFGAYHLNRMIAAMVVFDCGPTVHVQYIASSDAGRQNGGVDLIVKHLLDEVFMDRRWFDFGISTTEQGRSLNTGLAQQKEMFGARTTVYQQFSLPLQDVRSI
ncbi:GNAT family N-acetyltransferase [Phaeobacter sp.]|uniref:GNAT family N-acetyltransferase n=1 Tax=Phaeobacter sp. TaxID=1902409 RepID=UPI0025D21755|nr:GNAT family N-acetyltransferase [Phaeobacter sp.]